MHIPVLLHEVIENLDLHKGDTVLDATIGDGGHARELCAHIGEEGTFIGIDADGEALREAEHALSGSRPRVFLEKANFKDCDKVLKKHSIFSVNKICFDLGLRTRQLEASGRGFSLRRDEPLLMTYNDNPPLSSRTAYEIVNTWPREDLRYIFEKYGEERYARRIAEKIIARRKERKIERTKDLITVIEDALPRHARYGRLHFATKTFQALRIAVNDEFSSLEEGLRKCVQYLAPLGRIAVITFHSGEDRIVKNIFRTQEQDKVLRRVNKKPIVPGREELLRNPRARSAKLRIVEKYAH